MEYQDDIARQLMPAVKKALYRKRLQDLEERLNQVLEEVVALRAEQHSTSTPPAKEPESLPAAEGKSQADGDGAESTPPPKRFEIEIRLVWEYPQTG